MYAHWIKHIGYLFKRVLPPPAFTFVLARYHRLRFWLKTIPLSLVARVRVEGKVKRLSRGGNAKVRFGFYVVLDSMFQSRMVFELMLKDSRFDPFIVVVPRLGWCPGDMEETLNKTYTNLVASYGRDCVFKGYENGCFDNRIAECDACMMMNAYEGSTDRRFELAYFALRGVPIFVSPYWYDCGNLQANEYFSLGSLRFAYRFYCDNESEYRRYIKGQGGGKASEKVLVVGCSKADKIGFHENLPGRGNKTILIAPHHTVLPSVDSRICHGNFLRYKNFFLELPRRFPDIHWILRPHPSLKIRLIKDVGWTIGQWDAFISTFTANANAEYENGGAYYDSFERSDAIIEDCASFLPEYMYTGKPLCYMLASERVKIKQFDGWGQELLAHTYQAFDEEAIIRFIEDVVIGGNDTMRECRQSFAKERVMINYPHASEAIVESIAEVLGRGRKVS